LDRSALPAASGPEEAEWAGWPVDHRLAYLPCEQLDLTKVDAGSI